MKISTICPVYNAVELTMDYVAAQLTYLKPPHEIIVVDNASTDGTKAYLASMIRAGHPVKVVTNKKNLGFGGGHNAGAHAAMGDILVFLSNDVVAHGDFAAPLIETFTQNQRQLVGVQRHDGGTGWNEFRNVTIPYLAGHAIAIHRRGVFEVGLWDEQFYPCDYEDIDWSYRASKLGYALTVLDLPLTHIGSGHTANSLPGGRLAITHESQRKFCEKWGLEKV